MNRKEQIQALKDNEKPFGLMSEELQEQAEKLREIKNKCSMEVYTEHGWVPWANLNTMAGCATYRLRPDYEEEPEIERCEVLPQQYETEPIKFRGPAGPTCLHKAPSRQGFIGYEYEDGNVYPQPVMYNESGGFHFITTLRDINGGKDISVRPTHVLLRRQK